MGLINPKGRVALTSIYYYKGDVDQSLVHRYHPKGYREST